MNKEFVISLNRNEHQSTAERSRLSHFPTVVSPTDLITFFTLSDFDLSQVCKQPILLG
ncbi:hypothetical protein NUACC26_010070 [Scytonema sp. NUACC26]